MAATAIGTGRPVGRCSVGWILGAALLLGSNAACGGAGAPEDASAPNDSLASADPGSDVDAGEVPAGFAPAEPGSAARVFVNGEELPPELADAVRQAMQDQASLPDDLAEQVTGRFGLNAEPAPLPDDVGPDWAVVEDYLDQQRGWMESNAEQARRVVASSEEPATHIIERRADDPDASRAIAAAKAILDQDGAHEKTVEAAEFLVTRVHFGPNVSEHMVAGAKGLLAHAPGTTWRPTSCGPPAEPDWACSSARQRGPARLPTPRPTGSAPWRRRPV